MLRGSRGRDRFGRNTGWKRHVVVVTLLACGWAAEVASPMTINAVGLHVFVVEKDSGDRMLEALWRPMVVAGSAGGAQPGESPPGAVALCAGKSLVIYGKIETSSGVVVERRAGPIPVAEFATIVDNVTRRAELVMRC